MGKMHKHYPPIESRRQRIRRLALRGIVNLFVAVALGVGFYMLFSSILDTPAENEIRQSTQMLRSEYANLNERFEFLETVLDNIEERDRNVFHILFEAEPYNIGGDFESARWQQLKQLTAMTNNELAELFDKRMQEFEQNLGSNEQLLGRTYIDIHGMGAADNNIPAIQPILNNELTLLTASFGQRIQPYYKVLTMHTGVDYTVPEGTRVFATADGKVKTSTSRPSSTGNTIVIDHGNGYETHYHHLSKSLVKQGRTVRRGDIIALTGNSGLSLIPHLHYEIRYHDIPVDPVNYFFAELSPIGYDRIVNIARSGMQSFD